MPELNDIFSVAGWKTALGTLMSNPAETVQVIQANYPDVKVRQDEKGNYVMFSPRAGREFAIPPGFSVGDIPRAASALASFTPAGRATSIAGAGAASAATQAAIEATQAASGGEFSPSEVITSGVTGAALPAVTKLVSSIRQPLAKATGQAETPIMMQGVQAADNAPVPAATPAQSEEFGTLVRKAASGNVGSAKAKRQLAELAAINPEAKAAAEQLGFDIPADVLSDSRLLQETVGLSRSVKGTEASTAWADTIKRARDKADEVMAKIDASPDIATVSETVRQSLGKTRQELDDAADAIYKQVDAVMPKQVGVNLTNTQKTISTIISEVGEDNLTAAEKRLYKLASDPNTTYGALLREKSQIGKAMRQADSANPYGSVESGTLKRLYASLADDQIEVVGRGAGKEASDNLKYANQLVAKRKQLEDQIVDAFGEKGEGSIATKLTAAIRSGSKGDITQLNKIINTVPQDLRKESLASALMAQARTPNGQFSFQVFENIYQGLRKNTPVYSAISKEIGPEGSEMLRALYVVSKRINVAENQVQKTGKANQALLNAIIADGVVRKVMNSTVGRAAATTAGGVSGGPIGGAIAATAANAIANGKKDTLNAASKFLTSPEFEQLIADVAERGAEKAAVRKVAISPSFAAWANRAGLPKGITVRERWIRDAMLAGKQFNEEQK
jgi:hypothetical protein